MELQLGVIEMENFAAVPVEKDLDPAWAGNRGDAADTEEGVADKHPFLVDNSCRFHLR